MIANFQSSDRSFLQFRGFLDLHCRVLLDLQYDIECLEKELDALDQADATSRSRTKQLCLLSNKEDREEAEWQRTRPNQDPASTERSRPAVLKELRAKLTEYGMPDNLSKHAVVAHNIRRRLHDQNARSQPAPTPFASRLSQSDILVRIA